MRRKNLPTWAYILPFAGLFLALALQLILNGTLEVLTKTATPTSIVTETPRPIPTAFVFPTPTPSVVITTFQSQYANTFTGILTLDQFKKFCDANCTIDDFKEISTSTGGTAILYEHRSDKPCNTVVFKDISSTDILYFDPQRGNILYVEPPPKAYAICRQTLFGRIAK